MSAVPTRSSRRLLLLVVAALFLLTAGIAVWRVLALRDLAIERERSRLQSLVEDHVDRFEASVLSEMWDLTVQIAENPDRAAVNQGKLRASKGWFDALFLWVPGPGMLFPLPSAPGTSREMQESACLARAHGLERSSPDDVDAIVTEYVAGCRAEHAAVRLYAGKQAAHHLLGQGRAVDALAVLDATGLRDGVTLRQAVAAGVDPFEVATHRLARVEIRLYLEPGDASAFDLAATIGRELAELEAPDLDAAGVPMNQIHRLLGRAGRAETSAELGEGFRRAARRSEAYKQVVDRLVQEPPRPDQKSGRMVIDAYSEHPFLLHYGWAPGPAGPGGGDGPLLGVAFAIRENVLIERFLQHLPRALRGSTTVVDARTNDFAAGSRGGGNTVCGAQFRRTLTHLRVNVRNSALTAAVGASREQWAVPLSVISVASAMGLVLLFALDRTTRQQVELLERQRAFGTRVTHELKTPLAGIKVMAENLEVGAYKDDRQRQEMAHRIVQEADRLTQRVDEVLAAAKERTIPSPVPFEPEELVYALVEEWEPRMVDAGVAFEVDPGTTAPVLGDPAAFRDAVGCLLDNALKYRRPEGKPSIRMTLAEEGRYAVLSVVDNGLGVPKVMRKRIFDRFVRVEGPHRGAAGGHGLGLAQVREIVLAHRGTVVCTDGIDGGSTFTIRVPTQVENRKG
jgi:signal transduction histidine kinase